MGPHVFQSLLQPSELDNLLMIKECRQGVKSFMRENDQILKKTIMAKPRNVFTVKLSCLTFEFASLSIILKEIFMMNNFTLLMKSKKNVK